MDFSTMYGLMNPHGGDTFSLGNLLQDPEQAAKVFGGAGLSPPTGGGSAGLLDWLKSVAPELPPMGAAPFAGLGFPGTPAVQPGSVPTVPFGQSNLGQMFGGAPPTPMGPAFNEAFGSTPSGSPGPFTGPVPGGFGLNEPVPTPTPRPTGIPGTEPSGALAPSEQVPLPQPRPALAALGGLAEAPKPPAGPGVKDVLAGIKALQPPQAEVVKAGTPGIPHPSAMPRDIVAQLLEQMSARGRVPGGAQLRLAQALGGLRG